MTWSLADAAVDLHVWDQSGRHTWIDIRDEIPNAHTNGDVTTAGFETFTDEQWFLPVPAGGNRNLTYGVCLSTPEPTPVAVRMVRSDGTVYNVSPTLTKNAGRYYDSPNGYIPPNGWC